MCPELTRHTIPKSRDVGHFLSVTGTVIRASVAKVRNHMLTVQTYSPSKDPLFLNQDVWFLFMI